MNGSRGEIATTTHCQSSAVELAFLGDALEGLTGTLDPVLIVVTLRRQQFDHNVTAGRCGAPKCRRRIEYRLTDLIFVGADWNFVRRYRLDRRALCTDYSCRFCS